MSVRWETEGLQTVGIVCLVFMFLKLMHLLGLIDITETGEQRERLDFEGPSDGCALCSSLAVVRVLLIWPKCFRKSL